MELAQELKEKRSQLGKATQDARALGLKMKEAAKAGQGTGELTEQFNRAKDEAFQLGKEVNALETEVQLEECERLARGSLEPDLEPARGSFIHNLTHLFRGRDQQQIVVPRREGESRREMRNRMRKAAAFQKKTGLTAEGHSVAFDAFLHSKESDPANPTAAFNEARRAAAEFQGVRPEEVHIHQVNDDQLGGFLVSDDWRAELIKARAGFTVVMASGAPVMSTSKPSVIMPVVNRATVFPDIYSSDLTSGDSNWKGEAFTSGGTARTPQNKPTFGQEEIPVHIWQPDPVEITQELLDDADVDIAAVVRDLWAEVMGLDFDLAFLRGDGNGKPEGILNSGAQTFEVADASAYATPVDTDNGFSYPRVVGMFTSLPPQYRQRANWYMNSDTFGRMLTIEGSDGHPLFPINAMPGTLLNRPMWFTEFLDDGSTQGNNPVLFGDISYYKIVERRALGIMRLIERYAPNVALLPTARIGGQLVLKEAFRIGTTGA